MGLLDFFKSKSPEWMSVTEGSFTDQKLYAKANAKKMLGMVLEHCGFDKEDIREEKDLFSESMVDEIEGIRDEIESEKEDLKEYKNNLSKLKKQNLIQRIKN